MTIQILTRTQTKKMSVEAAMILVASTITSCCVSMICCDVCLNYKSSSKEDEVPQADDGFPVTPATDSPRVTENIQPSFTFPPVPEPPGPPPLPPKDVQLYDVTPDI